MEGYPPTGQPNEPGRAERRHGRLALAAALALGAVLCVGGYLGYRAYRDRSMQRQVRQADEHADALPDRLVRVEQRIASADAGKPADARRTLGDASRELDRVERELAAAHQDAEAIAATRVARPYAAGLDECEAAARSARAAVTRTARMADAGERAQAGLRKANTGTRLIASAIGSGNEEDYPAQEAKAREASALLAEAERVFGEADTIDRSAGLGQATAWAARSRAEADAIREQASAARSGDLVAYNDAVDGVNALTAEVDSMEHPPALTGANRTDPRLEHDLGEVKRHAERASASLDAAHAASAR